MRPEVAGTVPIHSGGEAFLAEFKLRVDRGLLSGKPHPRSNYVVSHSAPGRLQVRAADWKTALNVGLNDLDLDIPRPGLVSYRVRYRRWGSYVLLLCGALGLAGIALLLTLDVRGYLARHPGQAIPGLSIDQNLLVAWAIVIFWGFLWPWVLIALHRQMIHKLVRRLITEIDRPVQ